MAKRPKRRIFTRRDAEMLQYEIDREVDKIEDGLRAMRDLVADVSALPHSNWHIIELVHENRDYLRDILDRRSKFHDLREVTANR